MNERPHFQAADPEFAQRIRDSFARQGLMKHLGARISKVEAGSVEIRARYREELIRGLNEQGPEAYRAFIQNYFKRLTETKK